VRQFIATVEKCNKCKKMELGYAKIGLSRKLGQLLEGIMEILFLLIIGGVVVLLCRDWRRTK